MDAPPILEILVRMQIEWTELPRLRLTRRQAQRLWQLPDDVCETAFDTLVQRGFLAEAPDGAYMRHAFVRSSGALAASRRRGDR